MPHYSHDVVFSSTFVSVMKMYIVYSFEIAALYHIYVRRKKVSQIQISTPANQYFSDHDKLELVLTYSFFGGWITSYKVFYLASCVSDACILPHVCRYKGTQYFENQKQYY